MSFNKILVCLALIAFVLAAVNVLANGVALGLALLAASKLT
jgi:hypothetical protein